MDLDDKLRKVIEETQIFRSYKPKLSVQKQTIIPYIFLGSSVINIGDTVVRKGKVEVNPPYIVLPQNIPQFSGFEFEEELGTDENTLQTFLMIRGIQFPSLKYRNEISTIDVFEKKLEKTIEYYLNELEMEEDIETALIAGPIEHWQLSVLIYISMLVGRSSQSDIERYLKLLRKRFLNDS